MIPCSCLLTRTQNQVTPWNRLDDKLIVAQVVQKLTPFYKSPPQDPILSHMNPVIYFFNISLNVILLFMSRSPKWFLPLSFMG